MVGLGHSHILVKLCLIGKSYHHNYQFRDENSTGHMLGMGQIWIWVLLKNLGYLDRVDPLLWVFRSASMAVTSALR